MSKNKATYILCLKMMHLKIKSLKLTASLQMFFINMLVLEQNRLGTPDFSKDLLLYI